MRNVLITGAAGFIGGNLLRYLRRERPDWRLCALDALTYAGNLESIHDVIDEKNVFFTHLDIRDEEKIAALFEKEHFEIVFHLAAESHVDRSLHSAAEFVKTNVLGTQVLLDAARATNVQRFIHISTDEVYGSLGPTGRFVETTPLDPSSPYSSSKAASDLLVLAHAKTFGFPAMVTRCTNNYGPYQFPEKFIPLFITHAMQDKKLPLYGDGMNVRSWLYVDDHCDALLRVAERGRIGEVYNIGGSEEAEIPNLIVARTILELLGKPESLIQYVTDRPAHDRRYAIDYSKMKAELGWSPQVTFPAGLADTLQWYREHAQWWERVTSGEYRRFYELNYQTRN
jgi:dTDP-glucose 4,6-dehydratase